MCAQSISVSAIFRLSNLPLNNSLNRIHQARAKFDKREVNNCLAINQSF